MPRIWRVGLAFLVLTFGTIGDRAWGGVLFENAPNLSQSFATTSDAAGPQWSADDFVIAGTGAYEITSVTWWGRFSGTTFPAAASSNFIVEFYSGAGGPSISPWYRSTVGAVG